jgi:hypothetical protein
MSSRCTGAGEEAIVPVMSVTPYPNEDEHYADLPSVHLGRCGPPPDPITSVQHREAPRAVTTWAP